LDSSLISAIKTDLFWLIIIAFFVSFLTSGFFAVGEYNIAFSLTALNASILLKENELKNFWNITLLFSAVILMMSYEIMIFLSPLLFTLVILRLNQAKDDSINVKLSLAVSAFCNAAGFGVSLISILFPRDPNNLASAMNLVPAIKTGLFIYLVLMGMIFLVYWLLKNEILKKILIILAGLISLIYLLNQNFWIAPSMYPHFKILSGLMLAIILTLTCGYSFFKLDYLPLRTIALFLLLALIIPFYFQLYDFYQWGRVFEHEVMSHRGLVAIENTR
jgi:hypothetical protein